MFSPRPIPGALAASILLISFVPQTSQGSDSGWTGTLSYALLRNRDDSGRSNTFHDALSLTATRLRWLSHSVLFGPEIGYHGTETVQGIQCGPEWAVDCPAPGKLRAGLWQAAALARLQAGTGKLRPYAVLGAGPYLAGNFVVESRQAKIRRHLEPGVTAGLGVQAGFVGIEGRWHYVSDGTARSRYLFLEDRYEYSYSPVRIYSASVSLHFQ